jgi:phosphoenolpyruvate---glycerone phosphotransferase subunit DhaL
MITKAQVVAWMENSVEVLQERKAHLTELDSPIGDADHGINMARGFKKVQEKLPAVVDTDIGNILKTCGMALISSVGGASGPLYGTFLMRAGGAVQSKEELDGADLLRLIEVGVEGVVQRGRAEVGEKTMLDALIPATDALRARLDAGDDIPDALAAAVEAAEQGVKDTIPMIAKKGRASYLGERSIGHQDPGATSSYYLLATLLDVIKTADS